MRHIILGLLVLCTTGSASASVTVTPDTATAGAFGTWTVTYTVGESGITGGGGIRVEMPDEFFSGPRNSANRPQHTESGEDHYVSARCSRDGVTVKGEIEMLGNALLVKHHKPSLDGRFERYVMVVRVTIVEGALEPGDRIDVIFGDTGDGSRGYRAGDVLGQNLPILCAMRPTEDALWTPVANGATISIVPGPAAEMLFHAPSIVQAGEPIRLLISILDEHANPAAESADVLLNVDAGDADVPGSVTIPAGKSHVYFEAIPRASGVLRLSATAAGLNLAARANPVKVTTGPPEMFLYWGDLHSHTHFSWDGVGYDAFDYARNVSGLDFYARTDHALEPQADGTRGLREQNYAEYAAETEARNEPGRFVALHAYECSFRGPYGHHNVLFRGEPGPMHYPGRSTLPVLWDSLEKGAALTIPHHTGKFPSGLDWSVDDPEFRRSFEIYSGHGLSEAYDPEHPLAFEQSLFTSPGKSLQEKSNAVDVWMRGMRLSVVAASDDHRAKPGQPHYGLTAVRAPELTRDGVFQALYDRHTYGTTGAKLILDVMIDDKSVMGETVKVEGLFTLEVEAHGTNTIEWVELLRWLPGEEAFTVVQRWTPGTLDFDDAFTDHDARPGAIYYVRLRQTNTVRDRVVQAWSTPIWTE